MKTKPERNGSSRAAGKKRLLSRPAPSFSFAPLVRPLTIFAPAKLNLFLAVTGRRPDGFHDLVSVVAPIDLGDTLRVEPAGNFTVTCSDPEVPCDETNLVLKAARAYAAA